MRGAFLIALAIAAGSCKSDVPLPAARTDARDVASDMVADMAPNVVADMAPNVVVDMAPDIAAETAVDVPLDGGEAPVAEVSAEMSPVTCESIIKGYEDLVKGADKSCVVDGDCRIEGDANMTCDSRGLSVRCGVAVNTRAFPAAEAASLRSAASRLDCHTRIYDCGGWEAICMGGRCEERIISGCLNPEPARDGG